MVADMYKKQFYITNMDAIMVDYGTNWIYGQKCIGGRKLP